MRTLFFTVLLAAAASALTACTVFQSVLRYGDQGYRNPHVDCAACHWAAAPKAGKDCFAGHPDPWTACLSCHKYSENHHPVDFAAANPDRLPFPLYDGRVTCLTCHEIHGGTEHAGTPKLLRKGPYADRREICFKCHKAEEYAGVNPHIMFDDRGGPREINGKPVCLLCHTSKPDPLKDRSADVRFKADVGFLCWRCHPPMPASFLDKHFLVTPSEKTLSYMQEFEGRRNIILPLVPWGRITCSTCHNPHQKGVFSLIDASKGADAPKKLRSADMCGACHRF